MFKNLVSLRSKFLPPQIHCRLASTNVNEKSQAEIPESQPPMPEKESSINKVELLGIVSDSVFISQERNFGAFTLLTKVKNYETGRILQDWHRVISFDPDIIQSIKRDVKTDKKVYVSGFLTYVRNPATNARKAQVIIKDLKCLSSNDFAAD